MFVNTMLKLACMFWAMQLPSGVQLPDAMLTCSSFLQNLV